MKFRISIVFMLLALLLTACASGGAVNEALMENQPANDMSNADTMENDAHSGEDMTEEDASGNDAMSEENSAENDSQPEENTAEEDSAADSGGEADSSGGVMDLPNIPPVTFSGDEWFDPTPASQINLTSSQVQVFDFSAVWCSYCRQMAPVIQGLENLYGDQANFVMIDIDQDGANAYGPVIDALEYNPRFRPGIYILAPDGTILASWLGPVDGRVIQAELVAALDTYQ